MIYLPNGYRMIHSIDVRNFRCYRSLHIDVASRLNVIVGDNGVGKTALLEAIFLTLANASEVALRFRQARGLDGTFSGTARRIEDAMWGDFFTDRDFSNPISIALSGTGEDNRKLVIARGTSEATLSLEPSNVGQLSSGGSIHLIWTDADGNPRTVSPSVSPGGVNLPSTNEDLPDFFGMSAGVHIPSGEIAGRFSDLGFLGRKEEFIKEFCKEFSIIKDMSVEVYGGAPVLYATLKNGKRMALPNVSSGINKAAGLLITMASRPRSVFTIDEIETGIHYSHIEGVWRSLLRFMRRFDSQLFVSTHSYECLKALVDAADGKFSDISVWRVERGRDSPTIMEFSGDDLRLALEYDEEVR